MSQYFDILPQNALQLPVCVFVCFLRLYVTQKNFAIAFFIFVFLESVFRRTDVAVLLNTLEKCSY